MDEDEFKRLWENPPRFHVLGNEPWPDKIVVGGTVVAEIPPFDPAKLHEALTDEAGTRKSWIDDYREAWEKCKADPNCQGIFVSKRRRSRRYLTELELQQRLDAMPDFLKKKAVGESKQPVKHKPKPSRFAFLEGIKPHKSR